MSKSHLFPFNASRGVTHGNVIFYYKYLRISFFYILILDAMAKRSSSDALSGGNDYKRQRGEEPSRITTLNEATNITIRLSLKLISDNLEIIHRSLKMESDVLWTRREASLPNLNGVVTQDELDLFRQHDWEHEDAHFRTQRAWEAHMIAFNNYLRFALAMTEESFNQ